MTHNQSASSKSLRLRRSSRNFRSLGETLEPRLTLSVNMTGFEQLLIELVNKARANPAQEVSQLAGVTLNAGITGPGISNTPKQPLAPHQSLTQAAVAHSQDMLNNNYFSHVNLQNETPSDRARDAQYPSGAAENIAWSGSTGSINQLSLVHNRHAGLLRSSGHRLNIMDDTFTEIGTGIRFGDFTVQSTTYNAIMVTENFGKRDGNSFITGVAFTDGLVDDDFYTVGEGVAGVQLTATNVGTGATFSIATGSAGGYSLRVPNGTYNVAASGAGISGVITQTGVVVNNRNVKVDVVTTTTGSTPAPSPPAQDPTPQATNGIGIAILDDGNWSVVESTGNSLVNSTWGRWSDAVEWQDVQRADVNGDGRDDIIGRTNGRWWVARSDGSDFTNEPWGMWSPNIEWSHVQVGDFNGDFRDDVLGRTETGSWWVALSNGQSFVNQHFGKWTTRFEWQNVSVGDFNGDGRDDIAGRASTNGSWWVGLSNGNDFNASRWGGWTPNQAWNEINVGDFNGDGRDDLIGRVAAGTFWVATSNGTSFTNQPFANWSTAVTWRDIYVADLDGDGRDDLIGRTRGQWWVSRTRQSRVSNEQWGDWDPFANWEDVTLIDVDQDGMDDLVARNGNDWWVGRSSGSQLTSRMWGQWSGSDRFEAVVAGLFG